jgi:hypothetical protein
MKEGANAGKTVPLLKPADGKQIDFSLTKCCDTPGKAEAAPQAL